MDYPSPQDVWLASGFQSPQRPRLGNGLPAWISEPYIALPALSVQITRTWSWRIGLQLGRCEAGGYVGSMRFREVGDGELLQLLAHWRRSPEEALRKWWGCEPPSPPAGSPAGQAESSELSAEDLGL